MSADGEAPKESMSKRAIEQIMKLVTSQLGLERNQRRLEKKVRSSRIPASVKPLQPWLHLTMRTTRRSPLITCA
jgi:hypothetical protein